MEGSHRQRTPELWEALPDDIVDLIVAKVLDDPPFLLLHSLCSVCTRWRAALLPTPYLVYLQEGLGELAVLHPKRGVWETISLQFCQDQLQGLQIRELTLHSSFRGVLILSDTAHGGSASGEVIVCNPLTRRCWKRPAPPKRLSARFAMAATWQVSMNYEGELTHRLRLSLSLTTLMILHAEVTGQYQLGAQYRRKFGNRLHWFLFRRGEQSKRLGNALSTEGYCVLVNGDALQVSGAVNLGYRMLLEKFAVLAFDSERMECRAYGELTDDPHLEAGQSHRKQLFARIIDGNRLELFEIVGSGREAQITFPLSLSSVCRSLVRKIHSDLLAEASPSALSGTIVFVKVICIGQEDVVYYFGIISLTLDIGSKENMTTVWMHKPSNIASDWIRFPPRPDGRDELPLLIQIYQPSFEGPVGVAQAVIA